MNSSLYCEWIEDWALTPANVPLSQENGRTYGVAGAKDGSIYVFHQSDPAVLVFDFAGRLLRSFGSGFEQAHGLTLVTDPDGVEYLWLTDEGGWVAKLTLDGKIIQTIEKPDLPVYQNVRYSPTWVAVNPTNGDIYVADGYGSNLVHRYTRATEYIGSIDGTEGAGAFACPHGLYFDTRNGKEPELYIADRANRRVQVYDGSMRFKCSFGTDFLVSPCAFVAVGELLYIAELYGRVAVLDGDDKLIRYIGEDREIVGDGSWPSLRVPEYPNVPKEKVVRGTFIAPHGIGAGVDGAVYVVEWVIGGRITKLLPHQ